jgi:serine/threonine protein kinase
MIMLGDLKEFLVTLIARQLLLALNYMHHQNITHRDLKPNNIMFMKSGNRPGLKIIDMGFTCFFKENTPMNHILGIFDWKSNNFFRYCIFYESGIAAR